MTDPAHVQAGWRIRMEWGPTGAAALAADADLAVVVDVLSFTTTVSVAVENGIEVLPFPWHDDRAEQYAAERDATLAVGRLEARERPGAVSLSPASLAGVSGVRRLVLPSPNGSTITATLAGSGATLRDASSLGSSGTTVVAACLRNAAAVARWLGPRLAEGAVVAVVPAGERWPDGTLRPCAEDLWGAGAVLNGLDEDRMSPEARLAARGFRAVVDRLDEELTGCASGVELAAKGFADDVAAAARLDVSGGVPVLAGEAFVAAP